jgi:Tol biopolymer transport system component/dienelactone hydrolase
MTSVDELARKWARYPVLWSPHVSADGRWLAWTWTGATETGNIWIAPTDGSAPPRCVTDGVDHFYVNHVAANGKVLILSQSIGANEHDRLFHCDLTADASLRALTPLQADHYVFGGEIFADRFMVYAADYDYEARTITDGSWIYRQDLVSGERLVLARASSVTAVPPEISPDGDLVLYTRSDRHPAGVQLWMVGTDGRGDREILNVGDSKKIAASWLGTDGLVLVKAEAAAHERIGILDPASGAMRWLIDDPARCIESVLGSHDGSEIALVEYVGGRLHATLLDVTSGASRSFGPAGRSLLPVAALPGGDWIAEAYDSRDAHDLVRVDGSSGTLTNLTQTARCFGFASEDFAPASDYRWRSVDGHEIQGWLYEPKGPCRGLLVWVHGGPTWHSEDWINPIIQFLANAGYRVLDPNYRGSTGFGHEFREAIKEDGWGGREQQDIRTGIDSLIAAGKATPGGIGVVGLSYGGYSSWFAITRFADLVTAAMPICGMYDLAIDYHATGMPHGRLYSEEMMGGTPEALPERYFNASPSNFIGDIRGRLCIVHGLADSNVSPENTHHACRDLDHAGIPYDLLTFDDEGHGIYKARNRQALLERMAAFFGAALGGDRPSLCG